MNIKVELKVHIARDDETGIWYVAESDIPGLRLEADDPMALIERIRVAAPEMIELNQAEILANNTVAQRTVDYRDAERKVMPSLTPIFDSPLSLACA